MKQINAKLVQDLYRIQIPVTMKNTMVVGIDVVNAGRRAIIGMTASYSQHLTQHYTQVVKQDLLKELIGVSLSKDQQEERVCADRATILVEFLRKALQKYSQINKCLPGQIAIYRDGVGGPSY